MAKKDNFDFDTDSKAKFSFNFSFLKNLTKKQKELILMIAIAVVLVVAIVIIGVVILTGNTGGNGSNGGSTGDNIGDQDGGETGDEGSNESGEEVPDEITDFYISTIPTKTSYFVNDTADYSGLIVYIKSSNGTSMFVKYDNDPSEFVISGFDSSTPADEQIITVECKGFTDTFTIQIKEIILEAPRLESIHFGTYPMQIFSANDLFEYETGVLVCTYSDGSTKEIPLLLEYMYGLENVFDLSGKYILLPGEHTIQVEYGEKGIFVQTEYTITVTE